MCLVVAEIYTEVFQSDMKEAYLMPLSSVNEFISFFISQVVVMKNMDACSRIGTLPYKKKKNSFVTQKLKTASFFWMRYHQFMSIYTIDMQHLLKIFQMTFHCVQDEERRLVDNAIGCVYALSLKKPTLAESYFRSSMAINPEKRQK